MMTSLDVEFTPVNILDRSDDQIFLVPVDRPTVRVHDHMSGRNAAAENIAPFVVQLESAGGVMAYFHEDADFILAGVECEHALPEQFPNTMLLIEHSKLATRDVLLLHGTPGELS